MPIADIRKDYRQGELHESDVSPDPVEQFGRWLADAEKVMMEPTAMTLATADGAGRPSARMVLLKKFGPQGFDFYTNYESRKGTELAANPFAALVFFWDQLERSVRIEGSVTKVTRAESDEYFHARPIESQVGALVSHQSFVIPNRDGLEARAAESLKKYETDRIPLPDFWGGYRVTPARFEFWQGRPSRLHDRLRYTRARRRVDDRTPVTVIRDRGPVAN